MKVDKCATEINFAFLSHTTRMRVQRKLHNKLSRREISYACVCVCGWLLGVRVIIFAQRNALKTKVELEGLQRKKERVRNRKVASAEGQSRGKRLMRS